MSIVMTPFTWSLLSGAYSELDVIPGYSMLGNIGGRPYQNSNVGVTFYRLLRKDVEGLFREMGGVRDEYLETMDQYLKPLPGVSLLSILPNLIRMMVRQWKGLQNREAFLAQNPRWCREKCRGIEGIEEPWELADLMEKELLPRVRELFWRVVATTWVQSDRVGKARRQLVELVGREDADALLSNVSTEDELLASMGPVVELAKVVRGKLSPEAYLQEWGHRGEMETEAFFPRPVEDPGWLDRQLDAYCESAVDVDALLEEVQDRYQGAWDRLVARHPRKAGAVKRRLEGAAKATRMREALRSELARLVTVARAWALRAGELTGLGEGVFFLTLEENLSSLRGGEAPTETIPARKGTYERYQALGPYPMVIHGRFDPFRWATDPDRQTEFYDGHGLLSEIKPETPDDLVLGMPGSAGRYEGMVRRLDSPGEGDALRPGEVLVASQTNIGWTLLFPRVGAVVTDVGAPLSHAAIVARELGVPAVVNCGDATTRLRTGDRVRVDGIKGLVEILERGQGDHN
jgi:pyruvate,water dikinase